MKTLAITAFSVTLIALGGTHGVAFAAQAPAPLSPQQLFEAGQYDQALTALHPENDAAMSTEEHYFAALVLLRSSPSATDRAKDELNAVCEDENEAWRHTAESAKELIDGNTAGAIEAATRATAVGPDLFAAHYQLGLARARAENWTEAASAFDRASQINPEFAYAHYYAGIAYSRLRRADREAQHFEMFVRLAPKAPERLAVESILRTLRGR